MTALVKPAAFAAAFVFAVLAIGRAIDQELATAGAPLAVSSVDTGRVVVRGVQSERGGAGADLRKATPLATSSGGIDTAATYRDGLTKEFGDGLIRVNRLGPEAWRWALVKERRRADDLQRRLTRRVLQVRSLRRQVRSTLTVPTGHWLDGAFLCIHRFERGAAGWQTRTGNGYFGGLQMDSSFQRSHGAWARRAFGTADRWPASVQIAVAIQAWTTRGFGPWPSTRRMCGL